MSSEAEAKITQKSPPDSAIKIDKEKAGIVIVGEPKTGPRAGKMCIIAPWLEGAFDDGNKAYLLPRGSVDIGEEMEQAEDYLSAHIRDNLIEAMQTSYEDEPERVERFLGAIRETYEETGVDVTRIEGFPGGDDTVSRTPYEGVRIRNVIKMDEPLDQQLMKSQEIVPSSRSNPHRQTMYMVHVDGIENLMQHVKGRRDDVDADAIAVPKQREAATLAATYELPSFGAMMQMLRLGVMPKNPEDLKKNAWGEREDGSWFRKPEHWLYDDTVRKELLFTPSFDLVERDWLTQSLRKELQNPQAGQGLASPEVQAKLEKWLAGTDRYKQGDRMTPEEFDAFYQEQLERDKTGDKQSYANRLKKDVATIKGHLKGFYKDKIGDNVGLKLNTKNRPLRWSQEGADLLTLDEYGTRIANFAKENPAYGAMMSDFVVNDRMQCHKGEYKSSLQIIRELVTAAFREGDVYNQFIEQKDAPPATSVIPKGAMLLGQVMKDEPSRTAGLGGV